MSALHPAPPVLDWHNLYKNGWQGEIVAEAFQHPAKYARRLIARVYEHLLDDGLIRPGDRIVDPFGGVALGALDAMRLGLDWTGVELEPKFHALGQANIDRWNARYNRMPKWGSARLVNGDSRNLAALVGTASASVSSPPYADGCAHNGGLDSKPDKMSGGEYNGIGYTGDRYGSTAGQLGALPAGDFAAAVSSPPYDGLELQSGGWNPDVSQNKRGDTRFSTYNANNPANLGNSGATFWLAAREIVVQTYTVLAPGGVSAWVCKDFVRNRERVPFCDQWRQLCESVGFEYMFTARAWMVEDHGVQLGHDGADKRLRKERKSFFRRLNEKNGGPRIDFEEIIFLRRPVTK